MSTPPKTQRNGKENKESLGYTPDDKKSREGGDEALSDISPTDERADEKVIVNEQSENKTVNTPSQTAALPSESDGTQVE